MTAFLLLNACTTEYILMDENANPVESGYYTENTEGTSGVENMELAEYIMANDVFVVGEGADFVTYQSKMSELMKFRLWLLCIAPILRTEVRRTFVKSACTITVLCGLRLTASALQSKIPFPILYLKGIYYGKKSV